MELLMQGWFSGAAGAALVRLLNMSAAAAVLVCVVVLLRFLLRKAPKWTRCILWAIVAVQLICPVSLRSPLSVYSLLPRSNDVKTGQVEVFRRGGGSEKPYEGKEGNPVPHHEGLDLFLSPYQESPTISFLTYSTVAKFITDGKTMT